eukprot:8839385-Pyramimonas_sp.AAC.1
MQEAADAHVAEALLPDGSASRAADGWRPQGEREGPAADEYDPFADLDEYLDSVQAGGINEPLAHGMEQLAEPALEKATEVEEVASPKHRQHWPKADTKREH